MKKLVVKLDLQDGKAKQKALKLVSTLQGIDSIAVDMKEKKLTVVGTVDPINVVSKLRRYWHTDIVLVGPAKEPEKKEEGKAAAAEEPKKDQQAAAEPKKEDEEQKKEAEGEEEGKNKSGAKKEGEEKELGEKKKVEAISYYNNNYYDPRVVDLVRAYNYRSAYNNPHMTTSYYHVQSMEENPNACVIS